MRQKRLGFDSSAARHSLYLMTTRHALSLFIGICRYLPRAILLLAAIIASVLMAPIVCWFPVYSFETDVTGRPSQFPGMKRAFLPRWCRWMQSHDDCLDAYWYSGRAAWMGHDQAYYYDAHAWLRWACAVLWIWRNPAYGCAYWLGYDQDFMACELICDGLGAWDSGNPSLALYLANNIRHQHAFLFMWQWYFYRDHCLEIVLGWKIPDDDPVKNRAMLALRITPFKRYPL